MLKVPGAKGDTPTKGHELDSFINKISAFYGPGNPLKLNQYREFVRNQGGKPLKFGKIKEVRWAPSHLRAAINLQKQYKFLVMHLAIIAADKKTYGKPARDKANKLREGLLDENFVILLSLQIEILSLFSTQTLFYQYASQCVIGEFHRQKDFQEQLKKVKAGERLHMKKFLESVQCAKDETEYQRLVSNGEPIPNCMTIRKYENSLVKIYEGQRLLKLQDSKFAPVSKYLNTYVTALAKGHKDRFLGDDFLKHFDELDARLWKSREPPLMPNIEEHPIYKIGEFFGIPNYETLPAVWDLFKRMVKASSFYCTHMQRSF